MKKLTKQLYRNYIDFNNNGQSEKVPDEDGDFDCYLNGEDIITFRCDLRGDDNPLERGSEYVIYNQVNIDNVVRDVDEAANKKRKE